MDVRALEIAAECASRTASSRALTAIEIAALLGAGNRSVDATWSNVRMSGAVAVDTDRVTGCYFAGAVVLGRLASPAVASARGLPSGLFHSTLDECVLGDDVRVASCQLVQRVYVGAGACLAGCGVVSHDGAGDSAGDGAGDGAGHGAGHGAGDWPGLTHPFGNGVLIPVVVGVGGRDVAMYADMTLDEACAVAVRRGDAGLQARHSARVAAFATPLRALRRSVVEAGARVEACAVLRNVFIGGHARVSASHLDNCTVLSSEAEPSRVLAGSDVRDSILQWQTEVDSQAVVHGSFMCPCSHVERHGKLLDSVLGPYSGVAEGEVSESLVGPFVGFHHQALLIASYWPAGRGNVGYGANVGSNHTGKAPDQELWHGEGLFYGLGCSIKFPSDFSRAPYSLVATGVTTLPQRITMPFALISSAQTARPGVSPALNEISPAWVLARNMYAVKRNEAKFRKRGQKSPRVRIDFRIFRPATAAMMRQARDELARREHGPSGHGPRQTGETKQKEFYTDQDFPGIGKNVMTEAARAEAVETYGEFLTLYAAQGLLGQLASGALSPADCAACIAAAPADLASAESELAPIDYTFTGTAAPALGDGEREWRLQCALLKAEGPGRLGLVPGTDGVAAVLRWLREATLRVARGVLQSKEKDEVRGEKIIPGYVAAHGSVAESDSLVQKVFADADAVVASIDGLLAALSQPPSKL